jgi:hypothetical protein
MIEQYTPKKGLVAVNKKRKRKKKKIKNARSSSGNEKKIRKDI